MWNRLCRRMSRLRWRKNSAWRPRLRLNPSATMPLLVNIRHLETKEIHLEGEMPVAELELDTQDEIVHLKQPVKYDLMAEKMDQAILVQGQVELMVDCE